METSNGLSLPDSVSYANNEGLGVTSGSAWPGSLTCPPELNPLGQPPLCLQHGADLQIGWLSPDRPAPPGCGNPPGLIAPICQQGLQEFGKAVRKKLIN